MSNFDFLVPEWLQIQEAAVKAEETAHGDPRTSAFHSRRALELTIRWAYKADATLHLPYQDNISALLHEPTFKQTAGDAVFNKSRLIISIGNRAAHDARPIPEQAAVVAVEELFHVCYWLAHTYARGNRPHPQLTFDPAALPADTSATPQSMAMLQALESSLAERDEKLAAILADRDALDDQVKRLRAEVAKAKVANEAHRDTHDYSEAKTRTHLINGAPWMIGGDSRSRFRPEQGFWSSERRVEVACASAAGLWTARWAPCPAIVGTADACSSGQGWPRLRAGASG